MDRLVKSDVKELELIFQRDQNCSTTFKLTNLMHAMSVAVSLTATNPSPAFSIDRPFSTIPPLSSSTYTLSLSHPSAAPTAVTVRTSMLIAGKPHDGKDLRRIFSRPGPHVFTDAVIPVSLVGPHVAEYIISNQPQTPQTRSLLNKAISRCVSHSQLMNLLTYAVERGNADSVAVLMDAGADASYKDAKGKSLVPLAIRAGNIDVVKVLLASGRRIDNSVDFVLHEAAAASRVDLMELLLEFVDDGDDVNSVNREGRTPVHVAALHGHVEVIRFCVTIGGYANVVDRKGWTPLHCAASEGQLRAVECLLEFCYDVKHVVDREGKTAFAVAMDNGHLALGDLLHWGDVLFRAARVGDVHGMTSCLAVGGANVNGRDQNGWTPLHWAALKGRVKSVEVLIEHGADVDSVDDDGYTPLRCAVEAGHLQVALLLVARGSRASLSNMGFECVTLVPRRLNCFAGKYVLDCLSFVSGEMKSSDD